jgi:hypothetical protein
MKDIFSVTPTIIAIALAGLFIGGATFFSNHSASELQADDKNVVIPVSDSQLSDIKTVKDLETEVATLKTNLDSLYEAHNKLVEDHNQLLKYTTELSTSLTNASKNLSNTGLQRSTTNSSASLDKKVSDLQETISDVCRWVFSGVSNGCPSMLPTSGKILEYRIENLEAGVRRLEKGY